MAPSRALIVAVIAVLGVGFGASAAAAEALLGGELGRWIDGEAAPELGATLSRHPRFSGATVRLATVVPGAAPGQSNRLARAVERRLRQRLLEMDGVRLALDPPERGCAPPRTIDYLVRIEVSPVGARSLRVHVAVVDVAESVWVSGISHQWQGRVSAAERAAQAETVSQASAGSAASPISLDDPRAVAVAMKADLACLLPGGLDGALFVETPPRPPLARVGLALQSELAFEPLAALTADRGDARWLLTLEARDATADVHELSLNLTDSAGGAPQRVASVFVSGVIDAPAAASVVAVARAPEPPVPGPARGLLSALSVSASAPEGICDFRRARVNSCVEIDFELNAPAYLFVISTRDHALAEVSCGRLERSDAGPRRFRVRVPPGDYAVRGAAAGPDAGFYVIAAKSRTVASRLRVVLASAPGQCGSRERSAARWIAELQALLAREADGIAWRAVQLVHDRDGIVAL
ncbi:MAG: hypothetical protein RIC56_05205 [Pseudomonadales bacterium]